MRFFVFVSFKGTERGSNFCFGLNFRSGADFVFLYFHKWSERSEVRSHQTCRMIADSDKLLSDKTI